MHEYLESYEDYIHLPVDKGLKTVTNESSLLKSSEVAEPIL